MIEPILRMTSNELEALASAIRTGRIGNPFHSLSLQRVLSKADSPAVSRALELLNHEGAGPQLIAQMLELLVKDRERQSGTVASIDLVTTGPEAGGVSNRDTGVVVRELFANAKQSVLVVGFAVYQGQRVFSALAERMASCPALKVRLFLDVQRPAGDTSISADVARRFASRFVATQWPADRPLPPVYYYPASLALEKHQKACLHAKCVVVDGETAFVSSANFTEAAHERNVEVGVLLRSAPISDQLIRHFDALVADGLMVPL